MVTLPRKRVVMNTIFAVVDEMKKLNDHDIVTFGVDNLPITPLEGPRCLQSPVDITFVLNAGIEEGLTKWWHLTLVDDDGEGGAEQYEDNPDALLEGASHAILYGLAVSADGKARPIGCLALGEAELSARSAEEWIAYLESLVSGELVEGEEFKFTYTYGWPVETVVALLTLWALDHTGKTLEFLYDEKYVNPRKQQIIDAAKSQEDTGEFLTVGVLDNGTEVKMPHSVFDQLMEESGEDQASIMAWIMDNFNSGAYQINPHFRKAGE